MIQMQTSIPFSISLLILTSLTSLESAPYFDVNPPTKATISTNHITENAMKITIKQLPPSAWEQYRNLRLEALQLAPQAYGSTYTEEAAKTKEEYQKTLGHIWFAFVDETVAGMIGLIPDIGTPGKHRAHVVSFWVKPEYRKQGIGKMLVQHLQEIAPTQGIRKFYLHVTTTQESAIKLYESLGFFKVGLLKGNTRCCDEYLNQYLMEWHTNPIPDLLP